MSFLLVALTLFLGGREADAQGTAFTYQGGLSVNGAPANGNYDFGFSLYNDPQGGSQIGGTQTQIAVTVSNGLFTTTLDFSSAPWNGQSLWLQILVRTNGGSAFSTLAPRQSVTSSPYAIQSLNAATAGSANSLAATNLVGTILNSELPANPVFLGSVTAGSYSGNGNGLTNLNPANLVAGTAAINISGAAATAATASNVTGNIADFQLSTNVALLGAGNSFVGANSFAGVLMATNTNNLIYGNFTGNLAAGVITAGLLSGDGSALTNLAPVSLAAGTAAISISGNAATATTASNVTGTIADFQLSTNVAFLNGANSFNGTNEFAGVTIATNTNNLIFGSFTGNLAGNATTASSAGLAANAVTAANFVGSLSGDVTGTQDATTVASVGGQSAASIAAGASAANAATSTNAPGTIVMRDASGNFAVGMITATFVSANGGGLTNLNPASLATGTAAINISGNAASATTASSVTGTIADFQLSTNVSLLNATNSFTGINSFAGVTTATNANNLFSGTFTGNLNGNATTASSATTATTATTAVSANNFTGPLLGQVAGTQGATTVLTVGGQSAANVASGASAANSATSANTPSTIVKRDGTGSFSAGNIMGANISGAFSGNGSALTNLNPSQLNFGSAGNIDLGTAAVSGDSDTTRIGAAGTQTNAFIAGIYGATAASGVPVYVTSSNQLGTLTSSARFKEDIRGMDSASDALLALHPVTFRYKPAIDPARIPQFGLVAEEVEKVNPDLVAHDPQGRPYTVRYEAVNAMLLNEFLKEHRKVETQAEKIDQLTQRLDRLEKLMLQAAGRK